jgi:ABC-type proline/glycine betaine transport system substrate-binding protein
MKNTRFAIATALAGALTLAGCTAAAASATAGAGSAAPLSGLTHVMAYSINTDNPVLTSVVSGAIGDYGPAEEISPGSTGVSAHGGELELKLTHGTFRLNIADIDPHAERGS